MDLKSKRLYTPFPMNILIACEYSGTVREEFSKLGHEAVSCDLLQTEIPGKHIVGDVLPLLKKKWDMMVAFPPCTHLAVSGARFFKEKQKDGRQKEAIEFFMKMFWNKIPKVAIENPIGIMSTHFRKPDQIIQPWMFGHGETKATCLWLRGLPPLQPTKIVEGRKHLIHEMSPGPDRAKKRSLTYKGIAEAMAQQWGTK